MAFLNDLRQIIALAKKALELDYPKDIDKVKKILLLIRDLDLRQQYDIRTKEYLSDLMRGCEMILKTTNTILKRIERKEITQKELQDLLDSVVALEQWILEKNEGKKDLSLKELTKILMYNPKQARERGLLFRGISEDDYKKIKRGEMIYAADPFGHATLTEHILDPTNNPQTPFISLTENPVIAKRFGRVIVISKKKLQGHLYTPEEIESILRRDGTLWLRAKKLQRKNYEFILGPAKNVPAAIPSDAILR